jgi:AcrR family transcriptional regulator
VVRKYDASRRAALAQQTREAIVEAAFQLHGKGILDLESLAREANVSVATVRKHFPTRELLFQGCTTHGLGLVPMPDLEGIARIEDRSDRTREAVRQVYQLHEALLGQVWMGFKLADDSPSLAAVLEQLDGMVGAAAQIVSAASPGDTYGGDVFRGFVRGMLSPLTYRALRVHANLSPADATSQVADALVRAGEAEHRVDQTAVAYR